MTSPTLSLKNPKSFLNMASIFCKALSLFKCSLIHTYNILLDILFWYCNCVYLHDICTSDEPFLFTSTFIHKHLDMFYIQTLLPLISCFCTWRMLEISQYLNYKQVEDVLKCTWMFFVERVSDWQRVIQSHTKKSLPSHKWG